MRKILNYLKIKLFWFIYIYFAFLFAFSSFDNTGTMPLLIYSLGLYLICENAQVFFDFDRNKENCIQELLGQLPIKKSIYKKFLSIFTVCFILASTSIFMLTMSINFDLFGTKLIHCTVSWLCLTIGYVAFHFWETWIVNANVNISKYRSYFLILSILYSILNLANYTFSSDLVFNSSQITDRIVSFVLFVMCAIAIGYFENKRNEEEREPVKFKKSVNKYRNIMKLSQISNTSKKIKISGLSFAWMIYLFIDIIRNYGNHQFLFSIYVVGLITFLVFAGLLEHIYDRNSFMKLVPFSKKDIFVATFIQGCVYVVLTVLFLNLMYVGILFFRGNEINFEINFSSILMMIALFVTSAWVTCYGYASRYNKFFYFALAVVLFIIILALGIRVINLDKMQIGFVVIIILGGILALFNFFRVGYKRLSYK